MLLLFGDPIHPEQEPERYEFVENLRHLHVEDLPATGNHELKIKSPVSLEKIRRRPFFVALAVIITPSRLSNRESSQTVGATAG
jgi:hypothetical protein